MKVFIQQLIRALTIITAFLLLFPQIGKSQTLLNEKFNDFSLSNTNAVFNYEFGAAGDSVHHDATK